MGGNHKHVSQQEQAWQFYNGCSFIDLAIDVPDFLDLSRMRATGLQASEEELPDLMPPIVLPEDTRGRETISACAFKADTITGRA